MIPKMTTQQLIDWLATQDGQVRQSRRALHDQNEDSYCAVGHIIRKLFPEASFYYDINLADDSRSTASIILDGVRIHQYQGIAAITGLNDDDAAAFTRKITALNDNAGLSFSQIAQRLGAKTPTTPQPETLPSALPPAVTISRANPAPLPQYHAVPTA